MTLSECLTIVFTVGIIVLLNGCCENLCCCNLQTQCEDDVISNSETTSTTFEDDEILYSPIRRHATLLDEQWITE